MWNLLIGFLTVALVPDWLFLIRLRQRKNKFRAIKLTKCAAGKVAFHQGLLTEQDCQFPSWEGLGMGREGRERGGSWRALFRLFACIGSMNLVANPKRRSGSAVQNLADLRPEYPTRQRLGCSSV